MMLRPKVDATGFLCLLIGFLTVLLTPLLVQARQAPQSPQRWNLKADGRIRFARAFVVDDRLSALRREPTMKSRVIQRLRLARSVYVLESRINEGTMFYRVAVTRRSRGWIHEYSVAIPGRAGEDRRVLDLVPAAADPIDRLTLCRLFIDRFNRSPLMPRALLLMAEEADRAALSLIGRARRRLANTTSQRGVSARDFYLSDSGLDRYSRLRVHFEFDETDGRYVYDGQAYREIVKRFPRSEEAGKARAWLELAGYSH